VSSVFKAALSLVIVNICGVQVVHIYQLVCRSYVVAACQVAVILTSVGSCYQWSSLVILQEDTRLSSVRL